MGTPFDLAVGFHGTSADSVESIMREGLRPATGGGHWLLSGARYVFDEPSITLGYARSLFGENAAIIEVLYSTDRQLDLTRHDVGLAVSDFGQALLDGIAEEDIEKMRQNSALRELDDFALTEVTRLTNYQSVRAICAANGQPMNGKVYPPDKPFWNRGGKQSWLNLHNHVQVAIIDPAVILRLKLIDHSNIVID